MCGFFIEYRKNKNYFDRNKFFTGGNLLSHRGPDSKGDIFLENFSAIFYRLKILDLSNKANQPMESFNGRYIILFNGEIYNFREIKKKYKLKTNSNSDTEVIIQLFEKVGIKKMLDNLEGMFSFVIYDKFQNTIYFARDRFGIKPIYYFENNLKIVFSSEIKPLLKYTSNKLDNLKSLDFFLKQSMDNDDSTFFNKIKSLKPSYYGIVKSNNFKLEKYWSINKKNFNKENTSETKKKIKKLFSDSIKKHLISDRKIGFFFSGGTDSTSIISTAKKYLKDPKLFTYEFISNNKEISGEAEKAKDIANNLSLNLDVTSVTPKIIIENFGKVISICESPITSIRQVCDYLLFKKFKISNRPVAIIGHGGDELLGGYDYNFLNFLLDKHNKSKNFKKTINEIFEYFNFKKMDKKKKQETLFNILITISNQNGSTKDCTPFIEVDNFSKDFLNEYLDESYFEKKLSKQLNFLQNSQILDIENISLPRNLKYCDRLSMANGVEARVPFLDHKLATYLFNLKNNMKFRKNKSRWIFKSIFSNKTAKFFSKRKNSVPDPQSIWLKKDLKDFFLEEFFSKRFKENKMFNHKKVLKNVDAFHKNKLNSSFHLFQIFTYQKFLNEYKLQN
jgi:asparagine synthase (glutamine-hydrolysing)